MKLSESLKKLANGVNPKSGESLSSASIANTPEAIRLLYALSEEMALLESGKVKSSPTSNTRRSKIIREGKPANSHQPWSDDEKKGLAEDYKAGVSIDGMALEHERSTLAIVVQLEKLGLVDKEELDEFR